MTLPFNENCSIQKGSKIYYYTLMSSEVINSAILKWQKYCISERNWQNICLKPFKTTQEVKLRWFQYRILNRILPTNCFAYKLKLIDSESCTFCNETKENVVHLFWECKIVQNFWTHYVNWLTKYCNHICNLKLSRELVIFGFIKPSRFVFNSLMTK